VVQGRFYVAEVQMEPSGRDGRFRLVSSITVDGASSKEGR